MLFSLTCILIFLLRIVREGICCDTNEVRVQDILSQVSQSHGMGGGELLTLSNLIISHTGKVLHNSPEQGRVQERCGGPDLAH